MNKKKMEMELDVEMVCLLDEVITYANEEELAKLDPIEVIVIDALKLENPDYVEYICKGCDICESTDLLANYLQQHGFGNIKKAQIEVLEELKSLFSTECDYGGGDIKLVVDALIKELKSNG